MEKKTVLLVLCRKVIADLLIDKINSTQKLEAFGIYKFNEARSAAFTYNPNLALIEIPERNDDDPALDALDVCKDIKEANPDCKIMLLCPEKDKKSVNVCVEAKKRGEIGAFLFYEASVDYLVSQLESM